MKEFFSQIRRGILGALSHGQGLKGRAEAAARYPQARYPSWRALRSKHRGLPVTDEELRIPQSSNSLQMSDSWSLLDKWLEVRGGIVQQMQTLRDSGVSSLGPTGRTRWRTAANAGPEHHSLTIMTCFYSFPSQHAPPGSGV